MTKSKCKTIREELDELMLSEEYGAEALAHLSECRECREFREKQNRLREIVGSLGTVAAPADFDFRLRSRLASENSTTVYQWNRSIWSFGQRGVAATLALVLLFGAVMLVRYFSSKTPAPQPPLQMATGNENPSTPQQAPETAEQPKPKQPKSVEEIATISKTPKHVRTPRDSRTHLATVDSAGTGATVIGADEASASETVFPIDATQQSFKVSLFDGRGNPRTISVPTVSFGSQRVLPASNQLTPKGIW